MSMFASDLAVTDPVEQYLLARGSEVCKIFFRNFCIQVHMGIHAHEKGRTQPIRINLVLYLSADTAPENDSISEVFDYDRIHDGIHALVTGRHINLQETLAGEIADLCLGFPEILAVRASTEKTDIYPDSDGVGFELIRIREE
jgi:dihydroneopterin aldolase